MDEHEESCQELLLKRLKLATYADGFFKEIMTKVSKSVYDRLDFKRNFPEYSSGSRIYIDMWEPVFCENLRSKSAKWAAAIAKETKSDSGILDTHSTKKRRSTENDDLPIESSNEPKIKK
jgi:hypothetical protein